MKKILAILISLLIIQPVTYSRDYTKLQQKEMKHAKKYGSTQVRTKNLKIKSTITKSTDIKDPHILKIGNYEHISIDKYKEKLASDEKKYEEIEKSLNKIKLTNYNSQAKGEDYYKIYRIAERIIRANRLDYQTWRIGITRNAEDINAYSVNGNYINLDTSTIDSCIDNENALAMTIGHELAHILLGHQKRKDPILKRMERQYRLAKGGNGYSAFAYSILKRKLIIDSKNMEYAADTEGAKLAAKAGYDMSNATELLRIYETFDSGEDYRSDHPSPQKRIESFNQNIKVFPIAALQEWGRYNIYNTPVLKVSESSDRKSIIISGSGDDTNTNEFYKIESYEDMMLRFAYGSYLNSDFEKSVNYYEKYFEINNSNAIAYLYASYAAEELYKTTQNQKHKELANEYITKAINLDSSNKHIKNQKKSLEKL